MLLPPLHQELARVATITAESERDALPPHEIDRLELEGWLDTEIIPHIQQRAMYGKLPQTEMPALNDKVSALSITRAHNADAEIFGNRTLGSAAEKLYSAIHALRSTDPNAYPDLKQAIVIGELPISKNNIPTGDVAVEIGFPVSSTDHTGRPAFALVVSVIMPESCAAELQHLFADTTQGSEAIKTFIEKVAPGISRDANFTEGGRLLTREQTLNLHSRVIEKRRRPRGTVYDDRQFANAIRAGQPLSSTS
jgi:hypothetical protein